MEGGMVPPPALKSERAGSRQLSLWIANFGFQISNFELRTSHDGIASVIGVGEWGKES